MSVRIPEQPDDDDLIPTRQSLLSRLKDWEDQDSWRLFFETYWRLIYNAALRAGLSATEAEDAVQETVLSVMKSMPNFEYDAKNGSFKSWLLQLTRWRIADQYRKRARADLAGDARRTDSGTEIIEQIPDPASMAIEATWDEEWEKNLLAVALDRVKRKVDPAQYQVFHLYVFKKWPVSQVARTLRINPARVYMAKHRIGNLVKKEITALRATPF